MVRQGGGEAICLELDVTDSLSVTKIVFARRRARLVCRTFS
jgi:hypothetical protein